MPSFKVDVGDIPLPENKDGVTLPADALIILKQLLGLSANRTLALPLTLENQQRFAEEIGYRRALLEFASFFELPQEL